MRRRLTPGGRGSRRRSGERIELRRRGQSWSARARSGGEHRSPNPARLHDALRPILMRLRGAVTPGPRECVRRLARYAARGGSPLFAAALVGCFSAAGGAGRFFEPPSGSPPIQHLLAKGDTWAVGGGGRAAADGSLLSRSCRREDPGLLLRAPFPELQRDRQFDPLALRGTFSRSSLRRFGWVLWTRSGNVQRDGVASVANYRLRIRRVDNVPRHADPQLLWSGVTGTRVGVREAGFRALETGAAPGRCEELQTEPHRVDCIGWCPT